MEFLTLYTSELSDKHIADIMEVFNRTFDGDKNEEYFKWKYIDNAFGDSLHVIGYDEGKPILSRVFWRMDVNGIESYQPVDTSVLPSHQKRGLFSKTCKIAIEALEGKYIYNYPNDNSRPGYLKNGWKIKQESNIKFDSKSRVLKYYKDRTYIEDKFVVWRFLNHPFIEYKVTKHKGEYYLLSERQKHLYAILGKITNSFGLKQVNPIILFSYDDIELRFKIPNKKVVFLDNEIYTPNDGVIESYKFDML